jgi:hypothetical protein
VIIGGAVGVGVGVGKVGTALNAPVVARTSESIAPEVEYGVRSTVEVMIEYCTNFPSGCGGMVAE